MVDFYNIVQFIDDNMNALSCSRNYYKEIMSTLEIGFKYLEAKPQPKFVVTKLFFVDENGKIIGKSDQIDD